MIKELTQHIIYSMVVHYGDAFNIYRQAGAFIYALQLQYVRLCLRRRETTSDLS